MCLGYAHIGRGVGEDVMTQSELSAVASWPDEPTPSTRRATARGRVEHLDDLKVALTAAVITAHAIITYGAIGSWFYSEPLSSATARAVLSAPVVLGSAFGMGTFFFIAARFTPGSLARKGSARFLLDRTRRLALPVLLAVVVEIPLAVIAVRRTRTGAPLVEVVRHEVQQQVHLLDPGPMWFVAVLLAFSILFAGWRAARPEVVRASPLRPATLFAAGIAVFVGSLLVRLVFGIDSFQVLGLHVWQLPQCGVLFALGLLAGEHRPQELWTPTAVRWSGRLLALSAAATIALLATAGDDLSPYRGGLHWQSAMVDLLEGVASVSAVVWLDDLFRRRASRRRPSPRSVWLRRELAASAYGAFLLQTPVLVGLALALRTVPVPPGIKLLLLAPLAVALSFGAASLLRRTRAARRLTRSPGAGANGVPGT